MNNISHSGFSVRTQSSQEYTYKSAEETAAERHLDYILELESKSSHGYVDEYELLDKAWNEIEEKIKEVSKKNNSDFNQTLELKKQQKAIQEKIYLLKCKYNYV